MKLKLGEDYQKSLKLGEDYQESVSTLKDKDLKKIINNFNLEEYKKKCNDYSNVFYLMNLREDTHSKFLAWLFNIKNKNSIQYKFSKDFFKKVLGIDISKQQNIEVKPQKTSVKGRADIVITTEDYIIVIEVKLDARTSIRKDANGDRRTQYERYKLWVDENEEYKKKKQKYFILIYTTDERLKSKLEKNFKIGENKYKELNSDEIIEKLGYTRIQFSDIILILYNILKESYNKQLNKNPNDITKNLIEKFIKNTCDENNTKINDIYKKINKETIDKEFLRTKEYKRPQKCNIPIDKILKDFKNDEINELLFQYLDYWQYKDKIINTYTQIIEFNKHLYFIWDICEEIKDRKIEINEDENTMIKAVQQIEIYKAPSK